MRAVALCLVGALLAACSLQTPTPRKTPKQTLVRVAFDANFMKSCLAGQPGSLGKSYCLCTRDAIDDRLSDNELPKVSPADPRVRGAMHDCAAKYGMAIRPGF